MIPINCNSEKIGDVCCFEPFIQWSLYEKAMFLTSTQDEQKDKSMCTRIIYRFMGNDEFKRIKMLNKLTRDNVDPNQRTNHLFQTLCQNLRQISGRDDFGELIHTHTMTEYGGGPIGGSQVFAAFTHDVVRLTRSTDDQVQDIIRNANWLVTFCVPTEGVVNAASELSQSEGEVLAPNNPEALGACLLDYQENPYLGRL